MFTSFLEESIVREARWIAHPYGTDWTVIRKQFPLRLAYATTFNSCQGLTLAKTAVDLRIDPFAHGQLYTALSRVRHRNDSLLIFSEGNEEKDTTAVGNRRLGVCWSSDRIIQRDRAHLRQLRRQHLYFAAIFSSL